MEKPYKPGWIECGNCREHPGLANHNEHNEPCEECEGKGVIECEHPDYENNMCIACSYDQTDDLMDQAEQERYRQVDLAIDRKKEEKAFPMEATD